MALQKLLLWIGPNPNPTYTPGGRGLQVFCLDCDHIMSQVPNLFFLKKSDHSDSLLKPPHVPSPYETRIKQTDHFIFRPAREVK
ncbi:unnamed protein product [Bubo scandiacus]